MLRVLVALLALGACFKVPDFESGALRCDRGHCPPGMECRPDGRCYRPGDVIIDAPTCPEGEHRCVNGNLETCRSNVWVSGLPSCADLGQQCFDPGASGGTDAYCGTCLKGAQRCTAEAPPTRQTCPEETGIWTDAEPCDATFGCFDPDGPDAPAGYCGVCLTGDKRCNSGLQTCNAGQWEGPVDCTVMGPGWSCIDPVPAGGVDAYCGLCLKGEIVCHGDNRDQCNADGSLFVTLEPCTWGCDASGASCCAEPDCEGRVCAGSLTNACGRTRSCGPCSGNCCDDGFRCCLGNSFCCGSVCCSIGSCCEGDFCMPGGCP
jgi:hypothetical protein